MRRAAALAAAALGLSGCLATQQDMIGLSQQTDDLKAQVAQLKTTVASMQANQADLSVQIKQLREDLSAYTENVRALQNNMSALSSKLDDVGAQLAGKVTMLGQALSQAQQKSREEERAAWNAQKAALESQRQETSATETFMTAEKRLQAKDYAKAAAAFNDYLKRFSGGSLADVAVYDLGLSYEGLRDWAKAGTQFAVILEKYPKSGQTPGARLHYALCLMRLKKSYAEARQYLESVVADFPSSPEAKEAASVLKRLNKKKTPAKAAASS